VPPAPKVALENGFLTEPRSRIPQKTDFWRIRAPGWVKKPFSGASLFRFRLEISQLGKKRPFVGCFLSQRDNIESSPAF
jgi:hypothetical protein